MQEVSGMPGAELTAGGATANTIRAAQWMLQVPHAASFMGCVANDAFETILSEDASKLQVTVCAP